MEEGLYQTYQDLEFGLFYKLDPLSNISDLLANMTVADKLQGARDSLKQREASEKEIKHEYATSGTVPSSFASQRSAIIGNGARGAGTNGRRDLVPVSKFQFKRKL